MNFKCKDFPKKADAVAYLNRAMAQVRTAKKRTEEWEAESARRGTCIMRIQKLCKTQAHREDLSSLIISLCDSYLPPERHEAESETKDAEQIEYTEIDRRENKGNT